METVESGLIDRVRAYVFLYDHNSPYYRDSNKRQLAWEEIGKELGMKGEIAKESWDKLRRCFWNAIHRRANKNSPHSKKLWKYEQEMAFLKPYMGSLKYKVPISFTEEDSKDVNEQNYEELCDMEEAKIEICDIFGNYKPHAEPQEAESDENETDLPNSSEVLRKRRRENRDSPVQDLVRGMNAITSLRTPRYEVAQGTEMDETDMFFMSMAKMAKQLPPYEQARIKLQLSTSILQAQMKMTEGQHHNGNMPST